MTTISRRAVLKYLAASPVGLRGVVATGSLTTTILAPTQAHAFVEPMTAFAFASTVASAIAASNQGDGGLGALLEATQSRLSLVIEHIAVLEENVALVLDQLSHLSEDIRKSLVLEHVRELQLQCASIGQEYLRTLKTRDNYTSNKEWLAPKTQIRSKLERLLGKLEEARSGLRQEGAIGPTTALVMPMTAMLEHSLLTLLGYSKSNIETMLRETYAGWFDDMLNPSLSGSIPAYIQAAASQHSTEMGNAAKTALGTKLEMKNGSVLGACVGIDDYLPAKDPEVDCEPRMKPLGFRAAPARSSRPGERRVEAHDANVYLAALKCRVIGVGTPEKLRSKDRLYENVTLSERELVVQGETTGIILLHLTSDTETRFDPGQHVEGQPDEKSCSIAKANLPEPDDRLDAMKSSAAWIKAQADYADLSLLVDKINLQRASCGFGIATYALTQSGRRQFEALLERYS